MRSKKLIYILIALVILVLLNKFYFSKKSESTFNDEFLKIDTSQITQIVIRPKIENGKEITDFDSRDDVVSSLALQGNKIVVAGYTYIPGLSFYADFALARYTTAGALDGSFGENGKLKKICNGTKLFFVIMVLRN